MLSRPLFCFLLALHIPLTFFADNQSLFGFTGVIRTIVILLVIAAVFYFGSRRFFRYPMHAAAFASGPLVFYWLLPLGTLHATAAAAVAMCLPVLLGRWLDRRKLTVGINVIVLAMLVQPLYKIAHYQAAAAISPQSFAESDYGIFKPPANSLMAAQLTPKQPDQLPSILHITLDAYASDTVLREVVGIDNSPFSTALEELGFTVFPEAITPYNQTLLSMASIYSGKYLDFDVLESAAGPSRMKFAQLMVSGKAREALYPFGYTFAYNDNGYFADGAIRPRGAVIKGMPRKAGDISGFEFVSILQRAAFVGQVRSGVARLKGVLPARESSPPERAATATSVAVVSPLITLLLNALESDFVGTLPEPFHYSLHLLAPHPPFTIDRHGEPVDTWSRHFGDIVGASHAHRMDPELQRQYAEGYREKLLFINDAILAYVKDTMRQVEGPLVIIIHGDHGSGVLLDLDSAENSCLRERFSTYLAIYSSDPAVTESLRQHASPGFNLVNLYRVLFDELFEEEIPTKQGRAYFVAWKDIADRVQVTDERLKEPCPLPWLASE